MMEPLRCTLLLIRKKFLHPRDFKLAQSVASLLSPLSLASSSSLRNTSYTTYRNIISSSNATRARPRPISVRCWETREAQQQQQKQKQDAPPPAGKKS